MMVIIIIDHALISFVIIIIIYSAEQEIQPFCFYFIHKQTINDIILNVVNDINLENHKNIRKGVLVYEPFLTYMFSLGNF